MPRITRALLVAMSLSVAVLTAAQDEPAGTFVRTGDMSWFRNSHTETLLPDGRVLIAGGSGGVPGNPGGLALATAEIYDPGTGLFSTTGDMTQPRYSHTATLLPNGTVLIAGGFASFSSAETYNPATGAFSATGNMVVLRGFNDLFGFYTRTTGRRGHTASLLADGRVLLAGGGVGSSIALDAEIYDPSTGTFSPAGDTNCIVNPGGFSECGMTWLRNPPQ